MRSPRLRRRKALLAAAPLLLGTLAALHFWCSLPASSFGPDYAGNFAQARPAPVEALGQAPSQQRLKEVSASSNGAAPLPEGVPLIEHGSSDSAEAARKALQTLLATRDVRPNNIRHAHSLFAARRAALRQLLATDNGVRRAWNERLSRAAPRGIVVCAGGATPLANAFVSLYVLQRTLGCALPVALMHWGARELAPGTADFFRHHLPGVNLLDAQAAGDYPGYHRPPYSGAVPPPDPRVGYIIKAACLYLAPFREVLLLDADNTALRDPAPLFDLPAYARRGNVFWPDFWRHTPQLWDYLQLEEAHPWKQRREAWNFSEDGGRAPAAVASSAAAKGGGGVGSKVQLQPLQAESGQILIDRARHWEALEWALFLNSHAEVTYTRAGVNGDKDTFRAAFALAGRAGDYRQVPHPPAIPLVDRTLYNVTEEPRFLFLGMVQLHPDGGPLFHHRTAVSKLPPHGAAGDVSGPVTHLSATASHTQGTALLNGSPRWGLRGAQCRVLRCGRDCAGCSVDAIVDVDAVCNARSEAAKQAEPFPVTVVEVPREAALWRVTAAAAAAHALLPFQ